MSLQKTYEEVIGWYKEISLIAQVSSILQWDQRVCMPKKGLAFRSEQLAWLDGLQHRKFTDSAMVEKVNELAARSGELEADAQINIREIKRDQDRATKVPSQLVEEISRQISLSNAAWEEARHNNNYRHFAPYLEKMIDLRKQEAAALGFADHPYDAMLDLFEPFANEATIRELLEDLRVRLVPFIHKILGAEKHDASAILKFPYPIEKQRRFGLSVIGKIGFDFDGGRQDISAHPFCIGTLGDVRITTRFNEEDPRQSLFGMMHEAGHTLYEQGLPPEHQNTPLGQSVSLGVHESQSRFWENQVGRSHAFWEYMYPSFKKMFPKQTKGVSLEEFYRAINVVAPSLIRVEADEVTYNLHIILRFEIERAFFAGEVQVADLPELWRSKMKEYLDIKVPTDADGVLQDVHWSEGLMGYFPTYTIGNLYGAQVVEKIKEDLGGMDQLLRKGEFAPLLQWLRQNIHRHGKRFRGDELIERATGKKPSAVPFMNYLEQKYGPLYNL